ncbi:MAG: diguanylate cyclase [Syntrophomonadaceae bacterium]|nr:diguanylate cyclase [Syntrophomonadaceae bacterium]
MEQKPRESEEMYRLLFESAYDGIVLIEDKVIIDYNRRAAEIFGCPVREMIGSSVERFITPQQEDGRATADILLEKRDQVLGGVPQLFELTLCRCDGTKVEVELSLNALPIQDRKMVQVMVRDITERKQMEEWLRYLNMHDKPTGLYNRNYFEEEMQRMQSGRYDPVAVVVCDVDGLKMVNDNLGHDVGDLVLSTVARILTLCFRDGDVVARIGGDEFAVLLPKCPAERVQKACDKMRQAVEDCRRAEPSIPISLSIGWAIKWDSSQSMVKVFKEADNCMYREKPENRRKFKEFFDNVFMK